MQLPHLSATDPEIARLIHLEDERQKDGVSLIPSENHTSPAVLEALATTLSDKYAEGYPGQRYYTGNAIVDDVERLAQARAKELFGVAHVNVQPYSGSPANLAVTFALCAPGETLMGLDLPSGGHLTHGWKRNATGTLWKSVPYHVDTNGNFDFEEIATLAREHKPRLIWCGGTAIPTHIPFAAFAKIADEVDALLVADISHIAGLIVGGQHESPVAHAHLVTTTTHKTLRGPRGALIMVTDKGLARDPELPTKIDKAIIPGLQGGPHMNTIAGIAVALQEAAQPSFKEYARRVVDNARALADALTKEGFDLVSHGTENHLILVDFTKDGIGRGKLLHLALERIGLYTNMNAVPGEQSSPLYPSGLRLGTPAATTRGMGPAEMQHIAHWIKATVDHVRDIAIPTEKDARTNAYRDIETQIATDSWYAARREEVRALSQRFPVPAAEK